MSLIFGHWADDAELYRDDKESSNEYPADTKIRDYKQVFFCAKCKRELCTFKPDRGITVCPDCGSGIKWESTFTYTKCGVFQGRVLMMLYDSGSVLPCICGVGRMEIRNTAGYGPYAPHFQCQICGRRDHLERYELPDII